MPNTTLNRIRSATWIESWPAIAVMAAIPAALAAGWL